MADIITWLIIGFILLVVIAYKVAVHTPRDVRSAQMARIVCPHCHVTGSVITTSIKTKQGISGGKATGAILTGGVSLLATGLSRKVPTVRSQCVNCGMKWNV